MIVCTKCICYVGRVKQASGLAVGVSAVDSVDCPCLWDTCPRVSSNRHYREIKHGLVAHTWRMITKVTAEYLSSFQRVIKRQVSCLCVCAVSTPGDLREGHTTNSDLFCLPELSGFGDFTDISMSAQRDR